MTKRLVIPAVVLYWIQANKHKNFAICEARSVAISVFAKHPSWDHHRGFE
jgi:hypothetical protein